MTFIQKTAFLTKLPLEQKGWFIVCLIGSIITWFTIRFTPMKRLSSNMGHYLENRQVSVLASAEQIKKAQRIGSLMATVSKNVPWDCRCLSEALCVKWLLNRLDIPSVFYLGALIDKTDQQEKMKAHAWISVGPYIVIGAPAHSKYTPVSTFTTPCFQALIV